jgi:4'-phosphopantetheinyl transferase EntD
LDDRWNSFAPVLTDTELDPDASLVAKRRHEIIAGRILARILMAELGQTPGPTPRSRDRAPLWPDGTTGSITHTDGLCLVAMGTSKSGKTVGIDIERDKPLDKKLFPTIARQSELAKVDGDASHHVLSLFTAKEAFYKAQYPLTHRILGFQDVEIMFHGNSQFDVMVRTATDAEEFAKQAGSGWVWRSDAHLSAIWITR